MAESEEENFSESSDSSFDAFFEAYERADEPEIEEGAVGGILPYRYEPYLDEVHGSPDGSDEGEEEAEQDGAPNQDAPGDDNIPMDIQRLQNVQWCLCGRCEAMPTVPESVCCHEQARVSEKREERDGIQCITEHRGFQPVCLDEDVLATAYSSYRQHYGETLGNEWKRYTAYRQFVRWCYGHLGKDIRVPLPSCAVTTIRRTFFSVDYTGYREEGENRN